MAVHMIESLRLNERHYPQVLAVRSGSVLYAGSAVSQDSYTHTDREGLKIALRPLQRFAQVGGGQGGSTAAGTVSYQELCIQLNIINTIRATPSAEARRKDRIDRIIAKKPEVVPHLVKALKHTDKKIRSLAAEILSIIFKGTGDADTWKGFVCRRFVVPKIIQALKDREVSVRLSAVNALGAIGDESKEVKAALTLVSSKDANGDVRKAAQKALEDIKYAGFGGSGSQP